MSHPKQNPPTTPPAFTHEELVILNNALNEVCHGVSFGDDEFQTRIGYPRDKAQHLLKKIARVLGRKA
ncbi:MAG TPA: hypothetical protein VL371_13335 [Gemmataceae bacterium]|jgi:hypothetical protein|nr:hypothetical protein [Gemmataceae bacterium]